MIPFMPKICDDTLYVSSYKFWRSRYAANIIVFLWDPRGVIHEEKNAAEHNAERKAFPNVVFPRVVTLDANIFGYTKYIK